MSRTSARLDCTSTVDQTIAAHPDTAAVFAVFAAFGIDGCCGSALSVEEAAKREGVDAARLCAALEVAVAAA